MSQFGLMLRASAEREQAERERKAAAAREAAERAKAARAHDDALRQARRELERAIERVKAARDRRSGVVDADAAWRAAKARVIELETGAAPDWAPPSGGDDGEQAADAEPTDD